MPARDYPFIEIAVHPAVRQRYAEGAGLAVLSRDIDYVHWANGEAARRFGYSSIYGFLEDETFGDTVIARQIAAAAPRIGDGSPHKLVLRIGSGFRRMATTCTLERIRLPDGEDALLLALPPDDRLKDSLHRAEAMIGGFDDTDTHVAILDRDANTIAASPTFSTLAIEPIALEAMIEAIEREPSRLVKRQLGTRLGTLPAATAHIGDDPSLYLVFAVEPEPQVFAATPGDAPEEPASLSPSSPSHADTVGSAPPPVGVPAPAGTEPRSAPFAFDPGGRPVRFVWKIDQQGRFSEISPEFAAAVGPNAADVIGRTFDELARVFNLDPDGVIGELLRRRDTWSGKTVNWPVQGTPLCVPVDLAALPTYSRERVFDGFRGFGIIRIADAADDPERLGLALRPSSATFPDDRAPRSQPILGLGVPTPSNDDHAPPHVAHEPPAPFTEPNAPTEPSEPAAPLDHHDDDPFLGEVPALRVVETPARRTSDKVIDLERHRSRGREGLSRMDQAIFNQIGEELGRRLATRAERIGIDAPENEAPSATRAIPAPEPVKAVGLPRPPAPAEHIAAVHLPVVEVGVSIEVEQSADTAAAEHEVAINPARAVMTRALVDSLPLALLVHRGDELLHANDEWRELTGYDVPALARAGGIGALFAETERAPQRDEDASGRGAPLVMRAAHGAELPVKARLQSIGWHGSHALLLALSPLPAEPAHAAPSVHPSRAAEIEASELRSILETATDGVIILDEDGSIRSMNRSASALFDYDDDETAGQPFAMLFAHESQRAVLDYVAGLSDNGVASVLNDGREVIGREASGGFIPIFMTIGRLKGSNGYCAVIRDITQWKRTEEDLRAARRAAETANAHKSEFLARVSHEIRTPLNAIIGFSEMMATERFGPIGSPRYLEYAHDIGRSGRHVLDIVNDLLDISKIEAGEQQMDFTAVSLNDTLAETVSLLQPQANAQRVIIRTSLSTALPDVVADQRSIKQIAINLLSNAVRFTPAGGQIVVSTAYDAAGRVVMRVRDTGIGMSRIELDQAMKPFRQGSTSPSWPRGDGTGLGLPLTKAMVEANRAQFTIESTPGEGTLAQIAFPSQRVLAD
nr:PAS domain-containing sensor histidine kinase [Pararhizobium haloflavum]